MGQAHEVDHSRAHVGEEHETSAARTGRVEEAGVDARGTQRRDGERVARVARTRRDHHHGIAGGVDLREQATDKLIRTLQRGVQHLLDLRRRRERSEVTDTRQVRRFDEDHRPGLPRRPKRVDRRVKIGSHAEWCSAVGFQERRVDLTRGHRAVRAHQRVHREPAVGRDIGVDFEPIAVPDHRAPKATLRQRVPQRTDRDVDVLCIVGPCDRRDAELCDRARRVLAGSEGEGLARAQGPKPLTGREAFAVVGKPSGNRSSTRADREIRGGEVALANRAVGHVGDGRLREQPIKIREPQPHQVTPRDVRNRDHQDAIDRRRPTRRRGLRLACRRGSQASRGISPRRESGDPHRREDHNNENTRSDPALHAEADRNRGYSFTLIGPFGHRPNRSMSPQTPTTPLPRHPGRPRPAPRIDWLRHSPISKPRDLRCRRRSSNAPGRCGGGRSSSSVRRGPSVAKEACTPTGQCSGSDASIAPQPNEP